MLKNKDFIIFVLLKSVESHKNMELTNIINRDYYLQQLVSCRHNNMIKIVTGLRRSGKTVLLFNIFASWLQAEGVQEDHIIKIALDDMAYAKLRNPDNMLEYLDSKILDKGIYYVLIDEVQMLDDFVGILNHLLHIDNVDTYVTGSNSKFISTDVVTEFRGRGDVIHIYPFTFSEFYSFTGGSEFEAWKEYSKYGGLPEALFLQESKKTDFLLDIVDTVYLKDIRERYKIKNPNEFRELLRIVSSCVGSHCNPTKLSNTIKSEKGIRIDPKTIAHYLTFMKEAFFVEKTRCYCLQRRWPIRTLAKYYFQDIGLRNAILNFRCQDEEIIIKNVIYNELRHRGFRVEMGVIDSWIRINGKNQRKRFEVDFVVDLASIRYYIHSALYIPDRETYEQETASLKRINDSFRRVIITKDCIFPHYDDNGFYHLNLFDFLLKPELLPKR